LLHARSCAVCGLLVALVVLTARPVGAQVPASDAANRERVYGLLAALSRKVPEAARDLEWLRKSVRAGVPPEAVQGLERIDAALTRIDQLPEADRRNLIAAAEQDLRIKADYCRAHPEGMAALVPLVVHTWSPGEVKTEVRQWDVRYLSAVMAVFPDTPGDPFPGFSSPTAKSLPPGRYVVWAQDPENPSRRGTRKDVTLGNVKPVVPAEAVRADILVADK
jgi:hypothetical protein